MAIRCHLIKTGKYQENTVELSLRINFLLQELKDVKDIYDQLEHICGSELKKYSRRAKNCSSD